MTVVVSLEDFRPAPRYDSEPWTDAQIQEAPSASGPWTILETQTLTPVDSDPTSPAYRDFTTDLGTAAEQWYRIVFLDANASTGLPTVPVQNVDDDRVVYASVPELAAVLQVNANTRHNDLMRVLKAAADEIDSEIGPTDITGATTPYSNPVPLVRHVNLERASEHWKQLTSPFGVMGIGGDLGGVYTAQNSWERHANKLAVLKGSWGLA
jgi:hypothetical protein